MEYILFIHNNADTPATEEEWSCFFDTARKSGLFQGGSAIGKRMLFGQKEVVNTTSSVAGYMRFKSSDIETIKELLEEHPVYRHGGTLELCELPIT